MTTNKNGFYQGKIAFVTGAASGIGRATALAFGRARSATVKVMPRDKDSRQPV